MAVSELQAYRVGLVFLLLRCIRGSNGIPVFMKYTISNWSSFCTDFPAFCSGLVSHCEKLCKQKGRYSSGLFLNAVLVVLCALRMCVDSQHGDHRVADNLGGGGW